MSNNPPSLHHLRATMKEIEAYQNSPEGKIALHAQELDKAVHILFRTPQEHLHLEIQSIADSAMLLLLIVEKFATLEQIHEAGDKAANTYNEQRSTML